MGKKPPARSPNIDVFEDDDLNQAQALLSGDGVPEARGEGPSERRTRNAADTRPKPARETNEPRAAQSAEGLPASPEAASRGVEPTDAHLKFRVRQSTRARFDAFKAELSVALGGVRLADSNIGRAVVEWFLENAAECVVDLAREQRLRRPASDDPAGIAAFDEALVHMIQDALARD